MNLLLEYPPYHADTIQSKRGYLVSINSAIPYLHGISSDTDVLRSVRSPALRGDFLLTLSSSPPVEEGRMRYRVTPPYISFENVSD